MLKRMVRLLGFGIGLFVLSVGLFLTLAKLHVIDGRALLNISSSLFFTLGLFVAGLSVIFYVHRLDKGEKYLMYGSGTFSVTSDAPIYVMSHYPEERIFSFSVLLLALCILLNV